MKRTALHIVFIYTSVFLMMAAQCSEQNKNLANRKSVAALKLKNSFESDSLAEQTKIAFEERAIQKLYDFADYVNICSEKKLEKTFRDQSAEMITGLFLNDSVAINSIFINKNKDQILSPGNFVESLSGSKYNSLIIKISDVETVEHLHLTPDGLYIGRLNFNLQTSGITDNDTLSICNSRITVKIIAARLHKNFGTDERYIWNVFLGDMDEIKSDAGEVLQ